MDLISKFDLELSKISPAQCPGLLGELERLKAVLWARVLKSDRPSEDLSVQTKDLLDIPEVAKLLNIPQSRAYELSRRQDGFPTVRIGRYIRVNPSVLEQWRRFGNENIGMYGSLTIETRRGSGFVSRHVRDQRRKGCSPIRSRKP